MEGAEWRVASRAMRPPSITFMTFTGGPLGTLPPSMPESPQNPQQNHHGFPNAPQNPYPVLAEGTRRAAQPHDASP